ncbi:ABC transporter permease [Dethiothermospora halolimnae]|uniref:ABC transporter permease n=1 Tax=Dethiothermospora halolimnae TaxID=3114390 RepID=UPI003CCC1409
MTSLIYTEILKLKRSKILLLSILGSAIIPLILFIAELHKQYNIPNYIGNFESLGYGNIIMMGMFLGTISFGLVTSYIFNREYDEDTLKNILSISISRSKYIISKMIIILLWIVSFMYISLIISLLLSFIGRFEGLGLSEVLKIIKIYTSFGILSFLLTPFVMFITLVVKNYIPVVISMIVALMVGLFIAQTEYINIFPWMGPHMVIINVFDLPFSGVGTKVDFNLLKSIISMFGIFIVFTIGSIVYINKKDIK